MVGERLKKQLYVPLFFYLFFFSCSLGTAKPQKPPGERPGAGWRRAVRPAGGEPRSGLAMPRGKRSRSTGWRKVRALRLEDVRHWWMRRLPVLEWVPAYAWKENLVPDAVSGMMLVIQQVTQGTVSTAESHIWNWGPAELRWSSFIPLLS